MKLFFWLINSLLGRVAHYSLTLYVWLAWCKTTNGSCSDGVGVSS